MTEKTNPAPHVLTIMVDLSHPQFKDHGAVAVEAIIRIMEGCAQAAATGSQSMLITDNEHTPVAVYAITPDEDSAGKKVLLLIAEKIAEDLERDALSDAHERARRQRTETAEEG
jgi:hypothetical protein